ncbi:cytochrome b/b6 domain-containing protein [bacterium]|nr:cytochrome b/b6 domain-containing protein [bacterium]
MPLITAEALSASVHDGFDCTDCHEGIDELPHEDVLPAVQCGICHEEEDAEYVAHGRVMRGEDADLPSCTDCHGSHDIRTAEDPESPTSQRHVHEMCAKCHEDSRITDGHKIRMEHPVTLYRASVHGRALLEGKLNSAATCNDCHATDGSSHRILGAGNSLSTINHFNVPTTCGRCHDGIEQEYWEGIHGELTARGETDTPVCTHCHGEHQILRTDDPRSPVSSARVAEAVCTPCHESALLNERYGLEPGEESSFVDSYHGVKSGAGDATVANCASCHGVHRILPSSDPLSSVNPANLQQTCGECHPKITSVKATTTKIHAKSRDRNSGLARIFGLVYFVLIISVVGFMIFYAVADFARQLRAQRKGTQVIRMGPNALIQHTMLAVTFLLLVLTGFALRFSDGWPFRFLFGWDGGAEVRGILHRTSAVLFLFACIWHTVYLFTRKGRQFLRDMWPRLADGLQLAQMLRFNLGQGKEAPQFGRFGFVEKLEYWALIWGSVVMLLTGAALWFDRIALGLMTKEWLDVMLVVHFYEAVLASLAIAVWHLYSTVFNPAVYPGNPAWLHGRMPLAMYRHEHGADPDPPVDPESEQR